jgi:hypothetical protein
VLDDCEYVRAAGLPLEFKELIELTVPEPIDHRTKSQKRFVPSVPKTRTKLHHSLTADITVADVETLVVFRLPNIVCEPPRNDSGRYEVLLAVPLKREVSALPTWLVVPTSRFPLLSMRTRSVFPV